MASVYIEIKVHDYTADQLCDVVGAWLGKRQSEVTTLDVLAYLTEENMPLYYDVISEAIDEE